MKGLSIILFSLLSMSLSAADRYHVCHGKKASLTYAESSFLGEPVITLDYLTSRSWSGADIETNSMPDNYLKVSALDDNQPLMLNFIAPRPLDPTQEFHNYEMAVQIIDLRANVSRLVHMNCHSKKIHMWPVDLSAL